MLEVLIVLLIFVVLLGAFNQYVTLPAPIKQIINIVAIILICVWLLDVFGVVGTPHLRFHRW